MHFGSRACKIEQWILEEFNFEHLLFFRWHLSCLPSSFNRHTRLDSSGGPASASIRLRTSPTTLSQEPIFQDSAGPSKNGDTSPKNQGRRQPPHLHSHSMEELLSHYNQSKFSPDRYMMMLNRDQDRERGLPLCWLFETKALIGMVLVPMFLLVSFGFESLPLPVLTRLLKAVILDFFRMPLSTKIYFFISLSE